MLLRRELHLNGETSAAAGNGPADPAAVRHALQKALGTADVVPHSLFCRYLAREIQRDSHLDRLFRSLGEAQGTDSGGSLSPANLFA
jgi:hypothetical protein